MGLLNATKHNRFSIPAAYTFQHFAKMLSGTAICKVKKTIPNYNSKTDC